MSIHSQQHGVLSTADHAPGTTAAAGEVNVLGTNSSAAIAEVAVETPGAASTTSKIVRRSAAGHIAVPTSGQAAADVLSKQQIEALISAGIWKPPVHSVVAVHTAATVGNGTTGGPALAVGNQVINTTDKKVYTVTTGTGTGATVTWDAGYLPTTAEVRTDNLADDLWIYDVEGAVWANQGAADHARAHAITSTSDHSAGNWKVLHSNGSAAIVELALGTAGAPLLSGGAAAAPLFGAMLLSPTLPNAVGAVPADTDVTAIPVNTLGIVKGTGGAIYLFFKNATDVYYVQLTAI